MKKKDSHKDEQHSIQCCMGLWETPCTHYKVTTDLTLHISNALRACVRARAVTCSLHPPKYRYVVILTGSRIASHRSAFETTR